MGKWTAQPISSTFNCSDLAGCFPVVLGTNSPGVDRIGINNIAIGITAGNNNQGTGIPNSTGLPVPEIGSAIAIGTLAGRDYQTAYSIALGFESGNSYQGFDPSNPSVYLGSSVSIGYKAGKAYQGGRSVAIGYKAGSGLENTPFEGQGTSAVAIGVSAGQRNQGDYAVAIGNKAGITNQHSETIVISAIDTPLPF